MNASILEAARIEMARRRQLGGILARDGYRELINRARMKAVHLLRPRDRVWPVFFEDGIATNLNRPSLTRAGSVEPVDAIRWVMSRPVSARRGARRTLRILGHLQQQRYGARTYFGNPDCRSLKYHESIVRKVFGLTSKIGEVRKRMPDVDAIVATAWASARIVHEARGDWRRFCSSQGLRAIVPSGEQPRACREHLLREFPLHCHGPKSCHMTSIRKPTFPPSRRPSIALAPQWRLKELLRLLAQSQDRRVIAVTENRSAKLEPASTKAPAR